MKLVMWVENDNVQLQSLIFVMENVTAYFVAAWGGMYPVCG